MGKNTLDQISEMSKDELSEALMEMPELEKNDVIEEADLTIANLRLQYESLNNAYERLKKEHQESMFENTKRMNDINTFQCCEGELCLRGTDEQGKDFTVWWDAYDFLNWIDTDQIQYIKKQIKKHIDSK
jgi:hypothetical protein